ncbi:MAG: hypothetical protein QOE41_2101 [Mycobacterium sp.]|nr:hypothetical protein [Mycobacterium sp.]
MAYERRSALEWPPHSAKCKSIFVENPIAPMMCAANRMDIPAGPNRWGWLVVAAEGV